MKGQLRNIVLFFCTYIHVTYSRPVQIGNFYQFWKTVDKQSIPQTQALQKLTSTAIELLCETDEVDDSVPVSKTCDEYIQSLSLQLSLPVAPVTTVRHMKNPNKFMKLLIKSTVKNLNVYAELVQLMSDEYSQSNGDCQEDKICMILNSLSTNLKRLKQSIALKMKQYFKIKNVMKQNRKALSIQDKSRVEKVAILYGLFTQLKETESALEFVVKSTWDVHILQMNSFKKNKKKTRKLAQENLNLGL